MSTSESLDTKTFPLWQVILFTLKITWSISPVFAISTLFSVIYDGLKPLFLSGVTALVIDQALRLATQTEKDPKQLFALLSLFVIYSLVNRLISNFMAYYDMKFTYLAMTKLREMNYRALVNLGVETIEDPEVQNVQRRVEENLQAVYKYVNRIVNTSTSLVTVFGAGVSLLSIFPLGILIVILTSIPALVVDNYFVKKSWKFQLSNTEKRRYGYENMDYLRRTKYLPEVLITASYNLLLKKFDEFVSWWNSSLFAIYKRWYSLSFLSDNLKDIGNYVNYGAFLWQLINGIISVGSFTFYKSATDNFSGSIAGVILGYTRMIEAKQQVEPLMQLMTMRRSYPDGQIELPRLAEGPSISFDNVNFSYPRSETLIFKGLNLQIKSGEKIAIVGHNGAGKTTLVKLISRLYQPQEGLISINGHALNELKLDDWYKNIGVLFQEYNTYDHLTVKENIYIGRSAKEIDEEKIIEAAGNADAEDFINEMPDKYDQTLSERFKGGKRPSTGQWQKLAIARFFYRNAPLVIFDEPTASIDAVSEFKIFNRIYDFFKGKTVIIISHRFSTVRNADRIIVMDHGQIIEEGTHQQLLDLGGKYAEAFKLQAEGYN